MQAAKVGCSKGEVSRFLLGPLHTSTDLSDKLGLTTDQHLLKGWLSFYCLGLWIRPKLSNFFCLWLVVFLSGWHLLSAMAQTRPLYMGQHFRWGMLALAISLAGATWRQASFTPKKTPQGLLLCQRMAKACSSPCPWEDRLTQRNEMRCTEVCLLLPLLSHSLSAVLLFLDTGT